jgi:hypothetical protein
VLRKEGLSHAGKNVILPDAERAIWYERLCCQGYLHMYSALHQISHNTATLSARNIDISGL